MSRASSYAGPKLPKTLLDQVQGGRVSKGGREQSRKDRRQAERTQKKQSRSARGPPTAHERSRHSSNVNPALKRPQDISRRDKKPTKADSRASAHITADESPDDDEDGGAWEIGEDEEHDSDDSDDGEELAGSADEVDTGRAAGEHSSRTVPKAARARLEEDDAEIARLEKKLGIKTSSKTVRDDELDWLVNGSDSEGEADGSSGKRKRDTDDDEWLRDKRRKAKSQVSKDGRKDARENYSSEDDEDGMSEGQMEDYDQDVDDEEEDAFGGFSDDEFDDDDDDDEEEDAIEVPTRKRENPYTAPVSDAAVSTAAKYIPPSMRKPAAEDSEILAQLRRQLQGLLNRLSEANMPSILTSVSQIYATNARQHVTTCLIELLGTRIADPSTLNDTFLILHAGFATAVYRLFGIDFIAQFLEDLVKRYDAFTASATSSATSTEGKQPLNLLAFMANLYIFSAIGPDIIFDYVRLLLNDFNEASTELLLRVIRTCGPQLRQDDPSALKDIVLLLQRSIAAVGGESKVSVRTKFMVETIMDLKNNKMKHGGGASAMAAEHVTAMKKSLGSITANKNAKNTEPLRIGLKDLKDSEKKGKWWLIGASWRDPAKMAGESITGNQQSAAVAAEGDQNDGSRSKDLSAMARAQGMNTDVRRAIFFAVLDSVSFAHAHERVLKLNLKNKQMLEIPRVILRCASAEKEYNHFYTLVAAEFCKEHRLRKAWEFSLLDVFRRMGEDADDDDEELDEVHEKEKLSVREAYNLAKLYGVLVADGLLRITVLKALDFSKVDGLQPTTNVFVQVLTSTAILAIRANARKTAGSAGQHEKEDMFEAETKAMFAHASAAPNLALGLRYYFKRSFTKAAVAAVTKGKKERDTVLKGVKYAVESLEDGDQDTTERLGARPGSGMQDSNDESESDGRTMTF